jgi:3-oxoacyl-[acyl-carrier protein] reductase
MDWCILPAWWESGTEVLEEPYLRSWNANEGASLIDPGLAGTVAVVTGGNSGIGAAIAKALAAQGALVAIHYLDAPPKGPGEPFHILIAVEGEAGALKVAEEIRQAGGQATLVSGDLTHPDTISKIFDHAESAFGPVSVLVNNAAHCELPDTILSVTQASIDRHFRVNTRAAVLLMNEFIRRFRKHNLQTGRIISISTDAAQAFPTQIAYGASKAALEAFTRSVALEAGGFGITVNSIAPGPIQTGWIKPDLEEQVLPSIPLARLGTPQDIAGAVVFLASAQAGWLTGQVIKVSGGHAL